MIVVQCSISVVREMDVTTVALCVGSVVALVSGTVVLEFDLVITSSCFLLGV